MSRSFSTFFLLLILGGISGCIPDNYVFILEDQIGLENEVADAYVLVYDVESAKMFTRRAAAFIERRKSIKDRSEALAKSLVGAGTTPEKSIDSKSLESLQKRLAEAKGRVSSQVDRLQKLLPQMPPADATAVSAVLSKSAG